MLPLIVLIDSFFASVDYHDIVVPSILSVVANFLSKEEHFWPL